MSCKTILHIMILSKMDCTMTTSIFPVLLCFSNQISKNNFKKRFLLPQSRWLCLVSVKRFRHKKNQESSNKKIFLSKSTCIFSRFQEIGKPHSKSRKYLRVKSMSQNTIYRLLQEIVRLICIVVSLLSSKYSHFFLRISRSLSEILQPLVYRLTNRCLILQGCFILFVKDWHFFE